MDERRSNKVGYIDCTLPSKAQNINLFCRSFKFFKNMCGCVHKLFILLNEFSVKCFLSKESEQCHLTRDKFTNLACWNAFGKNVTGFVYCHQKQKFSFKVQSISLQNSKTMFVKLFEKVAFLAKISITPSVFCTVNLPIFKR